MQRLLSFPIQPDTLWPVHTALLLIFLLVFILLLYLCFLRSFIAFWLPLPLLSAPGSHVPHSFVSLCVCFLFFLHDVHVLTGVVLRLERETDFLVSFRGKQGCTGIVFLELLLVKKRISPLGCSGTLELSGCVAKGDPEKLAYVQWRFNLQRPELLYFTDLWACATIFPSSTPLYLHQIWMFFLGW